MTSGPPINLDYAGKPPGRPTRFRPAYLASRLITSYFAYAVVMAVLVFVVPRFAGAFKDFNVKLPPVTQILLGVSRACIQQYLWAVLLPVPGAWAILTSLGSASPTRRRLLRLGSFLIVAVFLIFTIFALFTPMMALIDGLASTKR